MSDIYFQNPYILLLIPLFLLCSKICKAKYTPIYFSNTTLLKSIKKPINTEEIIKYLAIFLLVLSLASPVYTSDYKKDNKSSIPLILCIDASESMIYDFVDDTIGDSKFKIAKKIAKKFILKRKNDQIALLFFGDYPYIASPLTYDKLFLETTLSLTKAKIAGESYTTIYDALYLSYMQLKNIQAKDKVIILISDGIDKDSNIEFKDIKNILLKDKITLYSIIIGEDYKYHPLIKLSKSSGGDYYHAKSEENLKDIFKKINNLKKTKQDSKIYKITKYYYQIPLFLSFFLFIIFLYIHNQRSII